MGGMEEGMKERKSELENCEEQGSLSSDRSIIIGFDLHNDVDDDDEYMVAEADDIFF